jgi:hypothetical protein
MGKLVSGATRKESRKTAALGAAVIAAGPWLAAGLAAVLAAVNLDQPMVEALLLLSFSVGLFLPRQLWQAFTVVFGVKLLLLIAVTVLTPWGSSLIPGNPDQYMYVSTAERIAEELQAHPFSVDYQAIVGLQNRSYNVILGWLAFFNGKPSILLYRVFNIFLSLVLAVLGCTVAGWLYPKRGKASHIVLISLGLLPSVNVYAMFVLRDVLLAVLMLLFAGSLLRRQWIILALTIFLTYYTRIQLAFWMLGIAGFAFFLRGVVRFLRARRMIPTMMVMGFILATYLVSPMLVPPKYDVYSATSFGRFLARFIPSFVGMDFLLADSSQLNVGRVSLALSRLVLVDSWLLPLLFLWMGLSWQHWRWQDAQWKELYVGLWAGLLAYFAGYWISYGGLMIRLWLPFYPLLLIVVFPFLWAALRQKRPSGERTKPSRPCA